MKKLQLLILFVFVLNIVGCTKSIPTEILGKYYNENGGGYIELNSDGTFEWISDGESVVNGTYYIKASEYNQLGYKSYHTIITTAKDGKYLTQWGVTDHIRQWKGYYDLRQDISGRYFYFKKRE